MFTADATNEASVRSNQGQSPPNAALLRAEQCQEPGQYRLRVVRRLLLHGLVLCFGFRQGPDYRNEGVTTANDDLHIPRRGRLGGVGWHQRICGPQSFVTHTGNRMQRPKHTTHASTTVQIFEIFARIFLQAVFHGYAVPDDERNEYLHTAGAHVVASRAALDAPGLRDWQLVVARHVVYRN